MKTFITQERNKLVLKERASTVRRNNVCFSTHLFLPQTRSQRIWKCHISTLHYCFVLY